jgi:opacity protein-like surface antigen
MKSLSFGIKITVMVLLGFAFLIPINSFARSPFYIEIRPGIYSPQSGDIDSFDNGFNGEIGFGWRFTRNIAAEFGIGYFYTEGEDTVVGKTYLGRELDIDVFPVTVTLKAILPYKKWELFGLAGAGVYFVSGTYDVEDWDHYHHDHDYDYDDDAIFGGFVGGGIRYNITRRLFVGVEGKYLMDR